MGRNHFAKTFASPYFQSEYYKNETPGGKAEQKVEQWFKNVFGLKKYKTKDKDLDS
jgi:hypothetical protein